MLSATHPVLKSCMRSLAEATEANTTPHTAPGVDGAHAAHKERASAVAGGSAQGARAAAAASWRAQGSLACKPRDDAAGLQSRPGSKDEDCQLSVERSARGVECK